MDDPSGNSFRILDYVITALLGVFGFLGSNTILRVNRLEREGLTREESDGRHDDVREDMQALRAETNKQYAALNLRLDTIHGLLLRRK